MRRPGRDQSGFTLIELMVVVIIISIAFTYGIVNIDHLVPSSRLGKAARDLGGTLTRIRGMAIFHGRSYFLEYDLDEHRYRVLRPSSRTEQDQGMDELIETTWFDLPRRVRFQAVFFEADRDGEVRGKHQIEFSPTGEVIGHMVQLVSADIRNEDRNKYTVELNAITGLVSYSRQEKAYTPVRDEFEFR
jgi:prepilin-type N-terminal cleavage/methylation domain-containing protein